MIISCRNFLFFHKDWLWQDVYGLCSIFWHSEGPLMVNILEIKWYLAVSRIRWESWLLMSIKRVRHAHPRSCVHSFLWSDCWSVCTVVLDRLIHVFLYMRLDTIVDLCRHWTLFDAAHFRHSHQSSVMKVSVIVQALNIERRNIFLVSYCWYKRTRGDVDVVFAQWCQLEPGLFQEKAMLVPLTRLERCFNFLLPHII